jgi:hypothetical protein
MMKIEELKLIDKMRCLEFLEGFCLIDGEYVTTVNTYASRLNDTNPDTLIEFDPDRDNGDMEFTIEQFDQAEWDSDSSLYITAPDGETFTICKLTPKYYDFDKLETYSKEQ